MQVLLTNDDGVEAPGLQAMHDSLTTFFEQAGQSVTLIVVAPDRGRSECSHTVTTTHDLLLTQTKPNWFHVDGTPVDCVRVALKLLCPDAAMVFSGVNAGANVGVDLLGSGTFAAAREAAILDRPAMAISHYRRPDMPRTWAHCQAWLTESLRRFCDVVLPTKPSILWNVNLPAVDPDGPIPETVRCMVEDQPLVRQGRLEPAGDPSCHRVEMRSDFHGRPRRVGSDVDVCFGGRISLSEIQPTLT
ncbi:MAG: 5'/3'-nucleotidase SurE [Planctomycetota bacterium]